MAKPKAQKYEYYLKTNNKIYKFISRYLRSIFINEYDINDGIIYTTPVNDDKMILDLEKIS